MKNNAVKNTVFGLVALFLFSVTSCDSDDDLPSGPPLVVNLFCYGTDSASSFESTKAFYNDVEEVRPSVYRTAAFITDESLTVDMNSELQGAGVLLEIVLYGDRDVVFQSGTYKIDPNQEIGNAFVSYDVDYDSTSSTNRGLILTSGYLRVTPYRTGYAIEIDGDDINGDRFHGIYLGDVTLL
ncbi:hypothetical protein [Nonlabens sp.]|jgi:hypothetical protein|uniref:hypothetical protein n=1 Tax=Nonlabens sp. TaxID=1888209 RepID=UPI0039E2942D